MPEIAADGHSGYFVRAVGNAIDILEILSERREPVSLARLTELLGRSKSSVFRILCTLEEKGLLERLPRDLFTLPHPGFTLRSNRQMERLKRAAQPFMRDLSRQFRETVSLAFVRENHIEIVEVIHSPQRIRMYNVPGGIIPPHASSLGKCIAAYQAEVVREHLLTTYGFHQFTPNTINDAAVLEEEFQRVREQGYAVDREESTMDGCCFGVPIRTSSDEVRAATSISMPKTRVADEERIIAALKRATEGVSQQLVSAEPHSAKNLK